MHVSVVTIHDQLMHVRTPNVLLFFHTYARLGLPVPAGTPPFASIILGTTSLIHARLDDGVRRHYIERERERGVRETPEAS